MLDIAYREKLDHLLREHLTESVKPAKEMIHPLKLTLEQLVGTHHALKVTCTFSYLYEHVIIPNRINIFRRWAIG